MPPKTSSYKTFKPPRPTASAGNGTDVHRTKGGGAAASKSRTLTSISDSELDSDPPLEMGDEHQDDSDTLMQDASTKPPEESSTIPPKLHARLAHEHFRHDDTRITKEAMSVLIKYLELFTTEAVGRANEERKEAAKHDPSVDGNFLEVEDLEKLAPQLLLDF